MLEICDLHYRAGKKEILSGVSLKAGQDGIKVLLGANGAGKSTLLRCVMNLERGYNGSILLCGKEARTLSFRETARRAALIPQFFPETPGFTARDMILMGSTAGLGVFGMPGEKEVTQAEAEARRLNIDSLLFHPFDTLSGGEKQLVLIARALLQGAPLLLMDEPDSALDPGNRARLSRLIKELAAAGHAVLLTTHDPEWAYTVADSAAVMKEGRLLADGIPCDVITEEMYRAAYSLDAEALDIGNGRARVFIPRGEEKR